MSVNDPFELQRLVDAEDNGGVYASAVSELRDGRKLSHWLCFVFPQIAGLGHPQPGFDCCVTELNRRPLPEP